MKSYEDSNRRQILVDKDTNKEYKTKGIDWEEIGLILFMIFLGNIYGLTIVIVLVYSIITSLI